VTGKGELRKMKFLMGIFFIFLLLMPGYSVSTSDFWFDTIKNIRDQVNIPATHSYDKVLRFFYFPSFRPIELYQVYLVDKQWYQSRTVIKRVDRNKLFEENSEKVRFDTSSSIGVTEKKSIESFVSDLKWNSFFSFHGDETENRGFDGETFYFEYRWDSKDTFFHYWNGNVSWKNIQMNTIANRFREFFKRFDEAEDK